MKSTVVKNPRFSVREALDLGAARLRPVNLDRAFLEARLLLSTAMQVSPEALLIHDDEKVSSQSWEDYDSLLKRRQNFEPIAYLIKRKEFYGLEFEVNPQVLIPRPETEGLVDGVLRYVQNEKLKLGKILDLGTGSGCIALTLASYLPKTFHIFGIDNSKNAIAMALVNSQRLKLRKPNFLVEDILQPTSLRSEKFSIIVSNPPYIPSGEIPGLQKDILDFEPLTALDGGKDGLDFFRAIFKIWWPALEDSGLLAFETKETAQAEEIRKLFPLETADSTIDGPHLFIRKKGIA